MDPTDRLVLVAGELHDLSGPEPAWPGGRATLFHQPGAPLPARADVDAIIPLVSQRVGEAELAGLPSLRVVANYGVGYDNIDLAAAARRGVVVTNTPDVLTDATADLALALLLAAARRMREGLDLARSGEWEGWHPTQLLGMGLQGRVLGDPGRRKDRRGDGEPGGGVRDGHRLLEPVDVAGHGGGSRRTAGRRPGASCSGRPTWSACTCR